MNKPKVSIIVPCYGVEKYLNRCVNSLVNQTLKDIEIILIDDESPDRVPEMCDEWAKKDNRIKVIHKKNGGLGFARNSGIDVASGEYVGFVDSDDFVELNTYEIAYEESVRNNLDICYFQYKRFNDNGDFAHTSKVKEPIYFFGRKDVDRYLFNMVGSLPNSGLPHINVNVWSGLYNMDRLKASRIRFLSERDIASEDMVFHLRYLPFVNKIMVLPNEFYNYYKNTNSITQTFDESKRTCLKRLMEQIGELLGSNYNANDYMVHSLSGKLRTFKTMLCYEVRSNIPLFKKWQIIKQDCSDPVVFDLTHDRTTSQFAFGDRCFIFAIRFRLVFLFLLYYSFRRNY